MLWSWRWLSIPVFWLAIVIHYTLSVIVGEILPLIWWCPRWRSWRWDLAAACISGPRRSRKRWRTSWWQHCPLRAIWKQRWWQLKEWLNLLFYTSPVSIVVNDDKYFRKYHVGSLALLSENKTHIDNIANVCPDALKEFWWWESCSLILRRLGFCKHWNVLPSPDTWSPGTISPVCSIVPVILVSYITTIRSVLWWYNNAWEPSDWYYVTLRMTVAKS